MRQRVMIAMGLINSPKLLIADEPTTALDVTVQAQILDLLQDLQREFNSAVIIITHDLGVVAEMADDVLVMYAGRAVEYGSCKEILSHPEMPYTWGLLSSVPDVAADTANRLIPIPGTPPSLLNPLTGCAFDPRCAHADKVPGDLLRHARCPSCCRAVGGHRHLKRLPPARPGRHLPGGSASGDRDRAGRRRGGAAMTESTYEKAENPEETSDQATEASAARSSSRDLGRASSSPHAPVEADLTREPILEVENLKMYFPVKSAGVDPPHGRPRAGGRRRLVRGAGRLIARTGGRVGLRQVDDRSPDHAALPADRWHASTSTAPRIDQLSKREMKPMRQDVQMIFQDPYTSLNPRHTVGSIVERPAARCTTCCRRSRCSAAFRSCSRSSDSTPSTTTATRTSSPAGSASASASPGRSPSSPSCIVADEPVSALDVSIQAQVVNLLQDLQKEFDIAFLFIAHDLAIVRHFCPEVAVMYLGKIVEIGDRESLYAHPRHPYTQALLSAVPDVKQAVTGGRRERIRLEGDVPSPINPPSGCRFRTRCPIAQEICAKHEPPLLQIGPRQKVACHFPGPLGAHPSQPVTTELLGVDDTGNPDPGRTPSTETLTQPGYEDRWFDIDKKQFVTS